MYSECAEQEYTIKLCDGIYLADIVAVGDEEFMTLVHATHVVNCSMIGVGIGQGLLLCELGWKEEEKIDTKMLMMFMDQAKERGESVLICADGSLSQCITVAVIYLMIKYICQRDRFKWALLKTIQFVGRKFKQMSIRGGYFSLLERIEKKLLDGEKLLSYNWEKRPEDYEELILRNTYLNSLEAGGKVVKSRSKSRRREKFEGKSRVSFVFKEFVEMSMGNTFQPKQEKLASVRLADMFSTNITVSVRSILDSSRNQQTKTLERQTSKPIIYPTKLEKQRSCNNLQNKPEFYNSFRLKEPIETKPTEEDDGYHARSSSRRHVDRCDKTDDQLNKKCKESPNLKRTKTEQSGEKLAKYKKNKTKREIELLERRYLGIKGIIEEISLRNKENYHPLANNLNNVFTNKAVDKTITVSKKTKRQIGQQNQQEKTFASLARQTNLAHNVKIRIY